MNEDPRWQHALTHFWQAKAAAEHGDLEGLAHRLDGLCNTLDSLAVDAAVARAERRLAARLLDKIQAPIRANLPGLLRRVAELRDTATDPAAAEFAALLAEATEHLPATSTARH